MAGLKNIHQFYGATPFEAIKGDDIISRHEKLLSKRLPSYCSYCGQEIIESTQDDNGRSVDLNWEMSYRMHYKCYLKKNK